MIKKNRSEAHLFHSYEVTVILYPRRPENSFTSSQSPETRHVCLDSGDYFTSLSQIYLLFLFVCFFISHLEQLSILNKTLKRRVERVLFLCVGVGVVP